MGADMIPNIYHFITGLRQQDEPFHLMHYLCLASCLAVNQPERVRLHCLNVPWGPWWERIRPFIEVVPVDPAAMMTFTYQDPNIARYSYAHQADFLRLQILLKEGGIYADLDTLFLQPPPREWFFEACVMGCERLDTKAGGDAEGSLCNALIMAEPGALFIQRWLDAMPGCFDGSWSAHSTFLPYRLSREHPALIRVEEEASFFALDWTQAGIAALFEQKIDLPEAARSVHLWAHLWWEAARRDFSNFSGNRLTPTYVRHARTTYAMAASAHLPAGPGQSWLRYRAEWLAARLTSFRWRSYK